MAFLTQQETHKIHELIIFMIVIIPHWTLLHLHLNCGAFI